MNARSIGEWFKNGKTRKRIIIPLFILIGLFIAGRVIDIHPYLQSLQDWIWKLGPWGPVAFGAIYVGAMLLLLPGTPFTIVAALLFGTLWGFVTMLTATTAVAVIAFFVARYVAKESIEKRLKDFQKFDQVKSWVEENRWLAIPFVRIMPVFPFALNNYALGLTRISFWVYLVASEIIFVPMTAVLVLGASALYTAMIQGEVSWGLILGSVGTGIVVMAVGLWGKKTFMNDPKPESDPPESRSE